MASHFKILIIVTAMLCFPFISQCQSGIDFEHCINKPKSKNFKYRVEIVETKYNAEYKFILKEEDLQITGNLETTQFINTKYNKYLSLEDKETIFKCFENVCLRKNFALQYASIENGTFTFLKEEEEDGYNSYIELYIPDTSEDFLRVNIMNEVGEFEIRDSIIIQDKSFEDYKYYIGPSKYFKSNAWRNYDLKYSPPELHFSDKTNWGFQHPASDGNKYISLITRDDESQEIIEQRLPSGLEKDSIYMISLDIRHEDRFRATTSGSKPMAIPFDKNICLKVTLSMTSDYFFQTIYISPPIENRDWKEIYFQFVPDKVYNIISFEAIPHNNNTGNGNIMIDKLSNIYQINFER